MYVVSTLKLSKMLIYYFQFRKYQTYPLKNVYFWSSTSNVKNAYIYLKPATFMQHYLFVYILAKSEDLHF